MFTFSSQRNIIEILYWYFHDIYYHPRTINVLHFWSEDFLNRKKEKTEYLLWEIIFLILLSFYSIMSSRFRLLHRFLLVKSVYNIAVYQSTTLFAFYFGTIVLLTILLYLPPLDHYFRRVYGDSVFKQLDWNARETILLESVTPMLIAAGGITLGSGLYVLDENMSAKQQKVWVESDQVTYARNYKKWQENGLITGLHDQQPGKPIPPNPNAYDNFRYRRAAILFIKDIATFTREVNEIPKSGAFISKNGNWESNPHHDWNHPNSDHGKTRDTN